MDKKIEVSVEKIRALRSSFNKRGEYSCALQLENTIPEAFEPEKHAAIVDLEFLINHPEIRVGDYRLLIQRIHSYFNDDGSLKSVNKESDRG